MKQRNLHNILQVGFQRCLYIEEERRMENAITFYILEPCVQGAKEVYMLNTATEIAARPIIPF